MRYRSLSIVLALAAVATAASARAGSGINSARLLLTDGATAIEGSAGGGISTWSVISGRKTRDGVGVTLHATRIELTSYDWQSEGIAVGLFNRVEISLAHQAFDTNAVGAQLGIGRDYTLDQTVIGAKLRLFGDVVYDNPFVPQISIGVQHKRNSDGNVTAAAGARSASGTDFYVSATKLFLSRSVLLSGTARLTDANQTGLLGFGNASGSGRSLQFEGSLGYQFSRRFVMGAEYRTKPDRLAFAREEDWKDVFVAYALSRRFTATAAYVDLGTIATAPRQRGGYVSLQAAF